MTIVAASILTAIWINVLTQMDYELRLDTYLFDLAVRFQRARVDDEMVMALAMPAGATPILRRPNRIVELG